MASNPNPRAGSHSNDDQKLTGTSITNSRSNITEYDHDTDTTNSTISAPPAPTESLPLGQDDIVEHNSNVRGDSSTIISSLAGFFPITSPSSLMRSRLEAIPNNNNGGSTTSPLFGSSREMIAWSSENSNSRRPFATTTNSTTPPPSSSFTGTLPSSSLPPPPLAIPASFETIDEDGFPPSPFASFDTNDNEGNNNNNNNNTSTSIPNYTDIIKRKKQQASTSNYFQPYSRQTASDIFRRPPSLAGIDNSHTPTNNTEEDDGMIIPVTITNTTSGETSFETIEDDNRNLPPLPFGFLDSDGSSDGGSRCHNNNDNDVVDRISRKKASNNSSKPQHDVLTNGNKSLVDSNTNTQETDVDPLRITAEGRRINTSSNSRTAGSPSILQTSASATTSTGAENIHTMPLQVLTEAYLVADVRHRSVPMISVEAEPLPNRDDGESDRGRAQEEVPWWKHKRTRMLLVAILLLVVMLAVAMGVLLSSRDDGIDAAAATTAAGGNGSEAADDDRTDASTTKGAASSDIALNPTVPANPPSISPTAIHLSTTSLSSPTPSPRPSASKSGPATSFSTSSNMTFTPTGSQSTRPITIQTTTVFPTYSRSTEMPSINPSSADYLAPTTMPTTIPRSMPPTLQHSSAMPSSRPTALESCIRIEFQTDNFGEETSWSLSSITTDELTNSTIHAVVEFADVGTYGPNEHVLKELCLSTGTYRFALKDSYGDGFGAGGGLYNISLDDREIIRGKFFKSEISHDILIGYNLKMNQRDHEWLDAHNIRRKERHERYGEIYVPLLWSPELATGASYWAEQLLVDCDGSGYKPEPGIGFGENIAKTRGKGQMHNPEFVLETWVEKEDSMSYPRNSELTQVLWRGSKYVGCGGALKEHDDGAKCGIWVCRYARAGNCDMNSFNASIGDNWLMPMLSDHSACGSSCPPEGCY